MFLTYIMTASVIETILVAIREQQYLPLYSQHQHLKTIRLTNYR